MSRVSDTVRRRTAGFTLIEVLVVLGILGLVTTIAVVQINSYWQRSRLQSATGDIRAFLQAAYTDAVNQRAPVTVLLRQPSGGAWQLERHNYLLTSPADLLGTYVIPDFVSLAYNPAETAGGWPKSGSLRAVVCDPRGLAYVPSGYVGSAVETPGGTPASANTVVQEVKTFSISHTRMVDGSLTPNTRFDIQILPVWNVSYNKVLL